MNQIANPSDRATCITHQFTRYVSKRKRNRKQRGKERSIMKKPFATKKEENLG